MRKWLAKYWWPLLIAAIVLCSVILVDIFKSESWLAKRVFDFLDDWAVVLSAAATVTLAIAAFWAVRQGGERTSIVIDENRRIRAEERESDFKRRCLDDIHEWVLKAIGFFSQERSMQTKHELELQIADLEPVWAEKASIVRASSAFNTHFQEAVEEATKNVGEYFNSLTRIMMHMPMITEKDVALALRETTRKSLVKVLESAAELKVKLQL